jgi:methionyl aminopeptidase
MERPILKSPDEIAKLRVANRIVAQALDLVGSMIAPGVSTWDIDQAVEKLIRDAGAVPTFKGYPAAGVGIQPYPASICASINEEVVHGIPSRDRFLQDGDIISVDIGTLINGYCGDATRSYAVGNISKKAQKLLDTCYRCLDNAIRVLKPGVILTEVCATVQKEAESNGFSVVKSFVGHGIGKEMHEPPQVPNYVTRGGRDTNIELPVGTVLAIEPMINAGRSEVLVKRDGWTVITKDHSLSAHCEHTVAITANGAEVLSVL